MFSSHVTKQDQVPPSHVNGKIFPIALNFGYDLVLLVHFLGHPAQRAFLKCATVQLCICSIVQLCSTILENMAEPTW